MRDEGWQDPLGGLFSGSSTEGDEEGWRGAASLDLSTVGLFSSHDEENEQDVGAQADVSIEPLGSGRDAAVAQVAAQQEAVPSDAEGGPLASWLSPIVAHAGIDGAAGPAAGDEQPPVGRPEPEGITELPLPLQAGSGEAHWVSEKTSTGRELAQERQRALHVLLGGATLVGAVSLAATFLGPPQPPALSLASTLLFLGSSAAAAAFALRGIRSEWRVVVLIGASYAFALSFIAQQGVGGAGPWYLLAIPAFVFVLASEHWGIVSGLANAMIYAVCAVAQHLGWLGEGAWASGLALSQLAVLIVSLAFLLAGIVTLHSLSARAERRLRSMLGQRGNVLRAAQAASAERQQALERAGVALSRQARHVELGAQVGRLATMGLSPDEMMARAVALVQQRVGADCVALYLLDQDRIYAERRAQAGVLAAPGDGVHGITRITDDVLLRQCVSSGRPRIMLGVDQVRELAGGEGGSPFLRHGTRSALALPLIARGEVFGAISLQSQSAAAFDGDDVATLRNVAHQVAIGISNAQLAGELGECLVRLGALQQRYARESWDPFPAKNVPSAYEYRGPEVGPARDDEPLPEGEEMAAAPSALLVPIALREQVLGVLGLHGRDGDAPWTREQLDLLAAVSEQMGLVIENSRLFAEARSRAAWEKRAREIVARLRQSLDADEILATAVREMGEALGLRDVTIRLTGAEERGGE
jgi:GAF domain-containing protein